MDFIFEFIFELVFEGLVEGVSSRKVPIVLRFLFGAVLGLLFGVLVFVMFAVAHQSRSPLVWIVAIGVTLLLVFAVVTKYREYRASK